MTPDKDLQGLPMSPSDCGMPSAHEVQMHGSNPRAFRFGSLRPDERRIIWFSLILLTFIYAATAYNLSKFQSFWSPDSGVRYAAVKSFTESGSLIHLQYRHQKVDPSGRFHPLGTSRRDMFDKGDLGYVVQMPWGFTTIYPPLFLLLSATAYGLSGFFGLTLWPMLGGIGAVAVTTALAGRLGLRSGFLLPLIMGLATPLALYSVVFWDHSLQIFTVSVAAYFFARSIGERSFRLSIAAGITLGIGIWLHDLLLAFAVAFFLAALPFAREPQRRRLLAGFLLGFLPLLGFWIGFNIWAYGVALGPHSLGPNQLTDPYHLHRMFSTTHLVRRITQQLFGMPTEDSLTWKFALLLLAYTISTRAGSLLRPVAPLFNLAGAGGALVLLLRVKEADGLFQAVPFLIPALAARTPPVGAPPEGPQHQKAKIAFEVYVWFARICIWYGAMVLINPIMPGLDWGSRYLLPLLPFLLLLSVRTLEDDYDFMKRNPLSGILQNSSMIGRGVVIMSAAALIVVSLYSQYRGFRIVREDLSYSRDLAKAIKSVHTDIVATDIWWLGPESATLARVKDLFLVRNTKPDQAAVLSLFKKLDVNEFTYVGTDEGRAAFLKIASQGKFAFIQVRVEEKVGLFFAAFRKVDTSSVTQPSGEPLKQPPFL